jgi:peptidoglycan/LPS O-acetylase OafA/YrhL
VSVLVVVELHTFPINIPAGITGVDRYFIISGYLITEFILDALWRALLAATSAVRPAAGPVARSIALAMPASAGKC